MVSEVEVSSSSVNVKLIGDKSVVTGLMANAERLHGQLDSDSRTLPSGVDIANTSQGHDVKLQLVDNVLQVCGTRDDVTKFWKSLDTAEVYTFSWAPQEMSVFNKNFLPKMKGVAVQSGKIIITSFGTEALQLKSKLEELHKRFMYDHLTLIVCDGLSTKVLPYLLTCFQNKPVFVNVSLTSSSFNDPNYNHASSKKGKNHINRSMLTKDLIDHLQL